MLLEDAQALATPVAHGGCSVLSPERQHEKIWQGFLCKCPRRTPVGGWQELGAYWSEKYGRGVKGGGGDRPPHPKGAHTSAEPAAWWGRCCPSCGPARSSMEGARILPQAWSPVPPPRVCLGRVLGSGASHAAFGRAPP